MKLPLALVWLGPDPAPSSSTVQLLTAEMAAMVYNELTGSSDVD